MIDRKNLTIVRRIFGLEINPIHGKFDVEHLKAIHRTIFQNLQVPPFAQPNHSLTFGRLMC